MRAGRAASAVGRSGGGHAPVYKPMFKFIDSGLAVPNASIPPPLPRPCILAPFLDPVDAPRPKSRGPVPRLQIHFAPIIIEQMTWQVASINHHQSIRPYESRRAESPMYLTCPFLYTPNNGATYATGTSTLHILLPHYRGGPQKGNVSALFAY